MNAVFISWKISTGVYLVVPSKVGGREKKQPVTGKDPVEFRLNLLKN